MSGGFFRGTSADQDTRFSNKQAKLMKSQKFAPELDHLVDMAKVKMDVMRPWIANRVTELIGFEDEVLINFIYSLLDGKEVNGKEVQISLTGFMERNTGKFMKELWALLLSAQKNASGVPQQFLDAKEEETKKKKAESDRIANEIQRKREKESQDLELGRNKKMDVGNDISKGANTVMEPARESRGRSAEEEPKGRNGSRGRSLKSPHSADRSSSPRRMRSRSASKSFSNSRSYSNERRRSRSLSASPKRRRRSSSSEMIRHSSPKRSLTPRWRRSPRRSLTPPRRRSSYSRRRLSPSPTRYRMRSPRRRRSRSPSGYRSRSPIRRRSRSPIWRSGARNRSRSPLWRRSPSPSRRRSPSPSRRRSPSLMRNRSPSPMRRRYRGSPLSPQPRSPSPVRRRSLMSSRRRSPSPAKSRSRSPYDWSSPSPVKRRSPLPSDRRSSPKRRRSPIKSPRWRKRDLEKDSPVCHTSPRGGARRGSRSLERRSRSHSWDHGTPRKVKQLSASPRMSSPVSEDERRVSINDDTRSSGRPRRSVDKSNTKISYSPPRKSRDHKPHHNSEKSADDKDIDYHREDDKLNYRSKGTSRTSDKRKDSQHRDDGDEFSPQRLGDSHAVQTQIRTGRTDSNEKVDLNISGKHHDALPKLSGNLDQKDQSSFEGSGSEESDKNQYKIRGKRKNKKPERQGSEDESSYDSYEEERREAKRRRKEERRSKKEEKRRRREERRRKKEEKRAEKLKLKSVDTVYSPSDAERKGGHSDDDQHSRRRQSHRRNVEQTEPEQKKLEIELREKALENLRAKKNIH